MTKPLEEIADEVIDEESFLIFVRALTADREKAVRMEVASPSSPYGPDAGGWENTTIESFLEGAAAWAEDSDFGRRMGIHLTIHVKRRHFSAYWHGHQS